MLLQVRVQFLILTATQEMKDFHPQIQMRAAVSNLVQLFATKLDVMESLCMIHSNKAKAVSL